MRTLKKILITCTTVALLFGSTLSVSAADIEDIFDATFYAENNPDVVAVCGNDAKALYKHYATYGINEGRSCGTLFNLENYRNTYADLKDAFGDDLAAYVKHYLTYGIAEGRDGGGEFDAVSYANRYPDLYEAYGYDLEDLYTHYQVFGTKENRDCLSQTVTDILEAQAAESEDGNNYSEAVQTALSYLAQAETAWANYHAVLESGDSVDELVPYVEAYNAIIDNLMEAVDQLTQEEMRGIVSPAMGAAYDRNGDGFLSYLAFG